MNRFDIEAKEWDKNKRRVELAKAVASFALRNGVKGDVLDFGCGTGLVSEHLCFERIFGYDTSKKMVEEFNKKFPSSASTIYPDMKFDSIVTSMTLHHIKDIDTLAKKLYNSLKDDGLLIVADLYKEDGSFHDKGNEGVFHFGFYPDRLKEIFEKEGFVTLNQEIVYVVKKTKEYPIFAIAFKKAIKPGA